MIARFADTFFYLALISRDDAAHRKAVDLGRRLKGRVVTTAWVITEVGDALANHDQRQNFIRLVENLRSDPGTVIVPPSEAHFDEGYRLYVNRPDKDWSLTDCISFTIMKEHGISAALTGDLLLD